MLVQPCPLLCFANLSYSLLLRDMSKTREEEATGMFMQKLALWNSLLKKKKKFTSLFSDARIQLYPYLFLVCCFTLGSYGPKALPSHIKHQRHSPKWALEETHTAIELYLFPFPRGRWPRVHTQRRKVDTNQTTVTSPPKRHKLQPEYEYLSG